MPYVLYGYTLYPGMVQEQNESMEILILPNPTTDIDMEFPHISAHPYWLPT